LSNYLIGLDLGTSSVKAGLYDQSGHEQAVAREAISLSVPVPGRAEQDPGEWWYAIQKVLKNLTERFDPQSIAGIGLSAQCPGHVLLGKDNEPIGKAIIWRDQRAVNESAWLNENVSPDDGLAWVGATRLGDPYSSPARLLWLKNNDPRHSQAAYVLQPKDFMGFMLTGRIATDPNTSFLVVHPQTHTYHPALLQLLGLAEGQLPPVFKYSDLLGRITRQAAQLTGLLEGTPVFVGTIDAYCDTLAGGAFIPGQAVDVSGTSEIVSLGVNEQVEGQGVFFARLDEGMQFLCGPMKVGGYLLSWLANSFYPEMNAQISYTRLEADAKQISAGADGLIFLPYLHGEKAPIWDSQVRGAFLGVSESHDRRSFTRAVYESVGYAVRHVLEVCEAVSGQKTESLITCGSGSGSVFWNTVKANILQKKVYPLQAKASACLGAAMIASTGLEHFPNLVDAWKGMRHFDREIQPESNLADRYDAMYDVYRRAYPGMQTVFEKHVG
jgi:xylulokinase